MKAISLSCLLLNNHILRARPKHKMIVPNAVESSIKFGLCDIRHDFFKHFTLSSLGNVIEHKEHCASIVVQLLAAEKSS